MEDMDRVALLMENKKDRNQTRRRVITVLSVLVSTAIFSVIVSTLNAAGLFREVVDHAPGECALVEGFVGGTEDFAPWYERRGMFVSSSDFSSASSPGKIYWIAFKKGAEPIDVTPELDFPLQPHGIDLYLDGKTRKLFVVNHRNSSALPQHANASGASAQHTVEIFDVSKKGKLKHERTVSGPLMRAPNDVAATSPSTFYVTNDHGWAEGLGRVLEDYMRLPIGDILYFDGESLQVAYEGTRYANGIISDGTSIWVAQTTGRTITRFAPSSPPGKLTPEHELEAHSGVDNITIDTDGALWVGAHPKLFDFLAHAKAPEQDRSPSHALRITGADDKLTSQDLYMNHGDPLSGSSVAVHHDGLLFMGAVYDRAILRCVGKTRARPE